MYVPIINEATAIKINISIFVKDRFDAVLFVLLIAAGLDYLRDVAFWKPNSQGFRLLQSLTNSRDEFV